MRVLDLTRVLSGPYATMLLADLGAEVIKVERPGVGDDTRAWGPPFSGGISTYFAAVNRGKRSVAIDLQTERGRGLVRRLADEVDILVENFRPGVGERLGLDYEHLASTNPGLVYASINGFGSHGPRAADAGTEVIVEAETGLMAMMGTPDGPPVRFGVAMVDIATGMVMVSGVLAALLERSRTGRGRRLEFPLYATAFSCLATVIASASVDPGQPGRALGQRAPVDRPLRRFGAADGFVVIGAINDLMWDRLVRGARSRRPLRGDPRTATNEARVGNRELVDGAIAQPSPGCRVAEVTARLNAVGVLVAPVREAAAAVTRPAGRRARPRRRARRRPPHPHAALRQFNPAGAAGRPAPRRRTPPGSSTSASSLDPGELRELVAAGVVAVAGDQDQVGDRRLSRAGSGRLSRSARRCCQRTSAERRSGDREQHRREHVDLDRDPALGGAEDVEREGDRRPRVEVRDDEVVDREREGERGGGEHARREQRQGDRPKARERARRRGRPRPPRGSGRSRSGASARRPPRS